MASELVRRLVQALRDSVEARYFVAWLIAFMGIAWLSGGLGHIRFWQECGLIALINVAFLVAPKWFVACFTGWLAVKAFYFGDGSLLILCTMGIGVLVLVDVMKVRR